MKYDEILASMKVNMEDDANTEFVVLVANGGGVCAYDNCESILNHSDGTVGGPTRGIKQTVDRWANLLADIPRS